MSKGILHLIFRTDSVIRTNVVRITPEKGGGMIGIALHVYRNGKQIFAKFRLFPQAVEEGNQFFDAKGQPPESDSADSEMFDQTPWPLGEEEPGGVEETDEVKQATTADEQFVKNNIKTVVTPASNVIPPGFKVRVFVDNKFIVEILKDQNQGGFVFTHPQAVARAKDLLEKLQGWKAF